MSVTAVVSTKNRNFSTLPLCLTSIALQTVCPDNLVIYDDGNHVDLREDLMYKGIFSLLRSKEIKWEVIFSDGSGQVANHNKSVFYGDSDFIWRVDDDEVSEHNVLEVLLSSMHDDVGAVGGLVLDPNFKVKISSVASNNIEDILLGLNIQWFEWVGVREVDHIYSTFLYRRKAAKEIGGYCLDLSSVGHREETIFTHEMKRSGWKLYINSGAVTHHLRASEGGIRSKTNKSLWEQDEIIFMKKMEYWGVDPRRYKIVILDNGLGDHFIFKKVLPDVIKKYGKDNIIIAACYPEVFAESGVKIASIAESEILVPNKDDLNVYKFMADHKWNKTVEEAYRGLYQL